MSSLPVGTVTFLFSDIEGSTNLLHQLGDEYPVSLRAHSVIIREVLAASGGVEVSSEGDSFFCVFASPLSAVTAAIDITTTLAAFDWTLDLPVRVRIGVHTGEGVLSGDDYVGLDVHRAARIAAAAHGGQVVLSEETVALARRGLPAGVQIRDLGLHALKDLPGPEHLFDLVIVGVLGEFPPLRSLDARPNNLPRALTNFVGRSSEMASLQERLLTSRLVTVVGPGGTGKTRMAVQTAAGMLDRFPDGVWLVPLQQVSDPGQVVQAVASVLRIREQPGLDLSDSISNTIGGQKLMLLLDNCEHLTRGCAKLAGDLLQESPNLQVLATSRQPLGIPGESLFRLPGLELPGLEPVPAVKDLAKNEAVELFVDRASQRSSGFALNEANSQDVAHICVRLDGLPLAIELAAARITVLDAAQIRKRLENRFTLLTSAVEGAVSSGQTLKVAMDWSYDLLDQREAELLRCASVFSGGVSIEAAEAVCVTETVPVDQVIDVLQQLVEKSLVVTSDRPGRTRYRMLNTVTDYARGKLDEAEEMQLRSGHADFFLTLGQDVEEDLAGSGSATQLVALDGLDADHSNIRAVLSFLIESNPQSSLRLAGAIWRFWEIRGYLSEGREFLRQALASAADAVPEMRAKALDGAGRIAWRQGDFDEAQALFSESLDLWRRIGNHAGEADSLHGLARAALNLGDHEQAQRRAEESLAIQRQLENRQGIATAINTLGEVARFRGDYETAHNRYSESLAIYVDVGDTAASVSVRHNLAYTALNQGDAAAAESGFHEALAIASELGDQLGIFSMVGGLATVAYTQGQPRRAAVLFGAADSIGKAGGYAGDMIDQAEVTQRLTATKEALTVEAFQSAWEQGQAMTQQQAIDLALADQ